MKQNLTFYLEVNKYENAMNKILCFSCIPLTMQSNPAFMLQSMTSISHAFWGTEFRDTTNTGCKFET